MQRESRQNQYRSHSRKEIEKTSRAYVAFLIPGRHGLLERFNWHGLALPRSEGRVPAKADNSSILKRRMKPKCARIPQAEGNPARKVWDHSAGKMERSSN